MRERFLDNFSLLIWNKFRSYSNLDIMIIVSKSQILYFEDVENIVWNLNIELREKDVKEWNSSIQSKVEESSHNAHI